MAILEDPMTHSIAWDQVTDTDVVRALQEYDRLGPDRFFSEISRAGRPVL